jgi:HK97 family phage major capsid protein
VRDKALQAIERHAEFSSTEATERVEKVVRRNDPQGLIARYLTAVGDRSYATAFSKMLGDPQMAHLKFSAREVEAVRTVTAIEAERAMVTTTTGVPVPYQLDPTLIYAGSGALNPFRQICRVETVTEGTWKGVNTQDVTLAYSAEAAESADNSPTLAQPSITTQRVIGFVPFSIELSQDWNSIVPELTGALSDGKDILDATAFLTGTGTNQPGGVLNIGGTGRLTTTQRVLTTTTAVYAVGDPYLLKAGLPARFINTSTYVAAPGVWDITFRFVGGNSTEPFQMPTRGGEMLGRPKVELSTMSTTVGTTGQKIMMLGDFKTGYLIADRLGMRRADPASRRIGQPFPDRPARPGGDLAHRRRRCRGECDQISRGQVMAKAVRAITSFVFEHDGTTVVVHAGDVFASTHAAVKNRRELFESEVPVEQAAPGQVR